MLSDVRLMGLQLATLFRHDAAGRLLTVNRPGNPPAPRLALGRTRAGNLWRFRHDLPATVVHDLSSLLATEPPPADLRAPPRTLESLLEVLARHAPVTSQRLGPAWRFPATITPPPAATARPITESAALAATFPGLAAVAAARPPIFGVWRDGVVVAVCCSARLSERAAEAGWRPSRHSVAGDTRLRRSRGGRSPCGGWGAYPSTARRGRIGPRRGWRERWGSYSTARTSNSPERPVAR